MCSTVPLGCRDPSGFGAAICVPVARHSIAFCNSVSGECSGMAASKFLAAAAACRILLMSANGALAADSFQFWRILCRSFSV